MRKFVVSVLALTLILTCFSIVTFAAPTTNIYMGDGSGNITATSDTVTIDVFVDPSSNDDMASCINLDGFGSAWGLDTVAINLAFDNATGVAKGASLTGLNDASGDAAIAFTNSGAFYTYSSEVFKLATITVNRTNEAASSTVKLSNALFKVGDVETVGLTCQDTLTITWPSSAPEPVVIAAEANREVAGYTDVVNFSSSLTNVTASAPTLTFDLYENGEFHKSYEESLGNGITLDGGTLSFKIAILGAPTDTTITLVNPAVK